MDMAYLKSLGTFLTKVNNHVIDVMDTKQVEFNDIVISIGDTSVNVPLNADTYSMLTEFVKEEMSYSLEDGDLLDVMQMVGELQVKVFEDNDYRMKDWFIVFESVNLIILNPFVDPSADYPVDPIECYGELFLRSGWFTGKFEELIERMRVTALDYAQATDRCGVYTDRARAIEFGEDDKLSFIEAFQYFVRYVHDENEYNDNYDSTYDLFSHNMDSAQLLVELAFCDNPKKYYTDLWNYGVKGYIECEFCVK